MYRLSAYTYTVAKFMMELLDIKFMEYVSLDRQLNGRMCTEFFFNVLVNLVRRVAVTKSKFFGRVLILDEYTVISNCCCC